MFSIVQNKEISHEALLDHFKQNKVEIANAITKPFPFLESLRDRSFITEKIYKDSQEAHKNLIPVSKVVYNILCYLEETFDKSLLRVLFSKVHLKEYPDLIHVHRIFENVIEDKYFPQKRDSEETRNLPNTGPSCEQVEEIRKSKRTGMEPDVEDGTMWRKRAEQKAPDESKVLRMNKRKSEKLCGLLYDWQVISGDSSGEDEPAAALSSAGGRGPAEEGEDGQLPTADPPASAFRAPAS